MSLPIRFPCVLAALLVVTACATPSSEPAAAADLGAPPAAQPQPSPPAAEEPAMTCRADKGLWAVGKIADEALVAKVQADTTSERVRVIRPGMAVTMDYREDRVNLDVDADNRVLGVRCT